MSSRRDRWFDVIHHGGPAIVGQAVGEIPRVLKAGGTCQGTMLSKRSSGYGAGIEIAPDTFVREPEPGDRTDADKDHPQFYCNAAEPVGLMSGFEILSLSDMERMKPGSWHWHVVTERPPRGAPPLGRGRREIRGRRWSAARR